MKEMKGKYKEDATYKVDFKDQRDQGGIDMRADIDRILNSMASSEMPGKLFSMLSPDVRNEHKEYKAIYIADIHLT